MSRYIDKHIAWQRRDTRRNTLARVADTAETGSRWPS